MNMKTDFTEPFTALSVADQIKAARDAVSGAEAAQTLEELKAVVATLGRLTLQQLSDHEYPSLT